MALVKCPECGRENVSDNAETCPDCGYGVKAHFEKIKYEERVQQEELEKQRQREESMEKIFPPDKPKVSIGFIIYVAIFTALSCWMGIDMGSFGIWLCEMLVFVFIPSGLYYMHYEGLYSDYKLAQNDLNAYRKLVITRREEHEKNEAKRREAAELAKAQRPECPYCHSHNLEKITTTSRVVSVGLTGLASKKIGKQWHCNNCRSDF